ncbi:restriction modification system DNA specificity domain-containing protein [Alcanivorax jadensis T9]|uniref:Restriction modification system DNA specificity domain-containing protein n=1 Tax=Alcanivorax jadensis T9 TaxID=1177181 RepID=A0ABR4WC85_9GAMM|nr:restriction modification system DNA specificity domain-containing protein [Alcanivorax jadensis T9]
MSWPLVKLKDCCQVVGGATPKRNIPEYWDSADVPWVTPKDVSKLSEPVLDDAPEYISDEGFRSCATSMLPKGSVLVTSRAPIGNIAITGKDMCTNQGFKSLIPGEKIDGLYLYYCMLAHSEKLQALGNGATFKEVSKKIVEGFEIPLPPLSEQKRIATILDKADAIRRKRQQAIQLTDEFLRAVFLDMFGDPVTNPKGWEIAKLSDVGTLDRGKSKHRPRNDPALLGGDYPLIQTGDVANSKGYIKKYKSTYSELGLEQSRLWPAGTLCITIAANIAKTGVLTFDACFPDSVVGFTPNHKATVEYVQHWLGFLQKTLEASAPESAQKNINLAILRNLDIPLPEIEKQRAFSELVERTIRLLEKSTVFISDNEYLFLSSSQKAFSGSL